MTAEQPLAPKLRFQGFTDAWEQRKLGDGATTFSGLSGKTKADFGHGDAEFITYVNVFQNAIANVNQTEPIGVDNKQATVKFGDVLFTTSSETRDEAGMSSVWLDSRPNVYLNSFCFGYRPPADYNPYFLAFMLRYWWQRSGISVIPNVRWGDSRTFTFCFDGLPSNSVLAVGTIGGAKQRMDKAIFGAGFIELIERLNPTDVVVYGPDIPEMITPLWSTLTNIHQFQSHTSQFFEERGH